MYCAYIVELKALRKHSNADRLLCTEVFGNNVIVSMDYYEGQKCVFFPTDGQLGLEFAEKNNLVRKKDENGNNIGGYLDPEKRNITALKLRGEKSEGLLMPIEALSDYTDITQLQPGNQITVLNGTVICEKYIPKSNLSKKESSSTKKGRKKQPKERISYPLFTEHVDTSQLAYNMNSFKSGDTVYLTLKMHGTSGRTGNCIKETRRRRNLVQRLFRRPTHIKREWEIVSDSRRVVLNTSQGDGYYGTTDFRKKYNDFFIGKLPKGFEVFYEIVGYVDDTGKTIMGTCSNKLVKDKEFEKQYGKETVFNYNCEVGTSDMYVYRITHTSEDGIVTEVPWEVVKIWCERWGCKHVPELDKFLFTTTEDLMERVNKWLDIPDPIGKTHVAEGVVVRIDNRESFKAYKHKGFYFKCLEGIIKDTADAPDMEEAQELILSDSEEG